MKGNRDINGKHLSSGDGAYILKESVQDFLSFDPPEEIDRRLCCFFLGVRQPSVKATVAGLDTKKQFFASFRYCFSSCRLMKLFGLTTICRNECATRRRPIRLIVLLDRPPFAGGRTNKIALYGPSRSILTSRR